MGNFFELSRLEKFCEEHPESILFAHLAYRYVELGYMDRARAIAEEGVRRHPAYAYGHYVLGLCYYHMNDLIKAKTHLELSLAYDRKNPRACKLMGEINEKLDLPIMAEESYLHYFLLDPFNPEAVKCYQREQELQFDEFEQPEGEVPESEFTGDETLFDEGTDRLEVDEGANIDDLFTPEEASGEDFDISRKVEEVFKETLGDISLESDWEDTSERAGEDRAAPSEPTLPEETAGDTLAESAPGGREEGEFSEDTDTDFESLFADLEETPEPPPSQAETFSPPDDDEIDFGNIFDESTPSGKTGEEPPSQPEETTSDEEDLLDFTAAVEDFIAERQDASSGEAPAPPPEDEETTADSIQWDAQNTVPDLSHLPSQPDRPGAQEAASTPGETTRFGKPPILSPTLGEIYVAQGRYQEAIEVFRQLLEKDPGNQRFRKKIQDIQMILERQK